MTITDKPKVVVGMSGGVDSSIAAALLKEEGYDVIGVTLQIWPSAGPDVEGGCCSISAIDDAKRIAFQLGIPHYVLNFRSYFEENVIDYFTASYLKGETPNPCVMCNRVVRWGEMLQKAQGLGADYIATGHYAQILRNPENGRLFLNRPEDTWKDQTYMLYTLTQDQLAHTLFPLADYKKERIREMAEERGLLRVARKPDSQEICFIPDNDYASFVEKRATEPIKPGNFVDKQGHVLGRHQGLVHYTVGQRKGLGVTFGKPMFVVGFNTERNEVVLGEDPEVFSDALYATDLNWMAIEDLTEPLKVSAKIRYKASLAPAMIYPVENSEQIKGAIGACVKVQFETPQRAITPGQVVVFYDGDRVIGGGKIISDPRGI
ncbi:tRNA 2-thiouridine(34) synthase MnmA [Desulfitobacterium metallireducens]|uniref:tRNA-specific 2-thiouridylase MnmA n=1 Tax=Desulfitobacterium metallireducens DSM 15288 TaxID=871968 RepID=W0EE19_9FIRM|nr:tRNA 2-thiouridine(34) synthase MnmA [Desulfitobacterium metallireducens]AHF07449.1 thiouridylase [Desulfitobacterium metallireducens DSM 15288]